MSRRAQTSPFDRFGMDRAYVDPLGRTLFRFLHDVWWRIETRGLGHVPRRGRAVIVGVHRGHQPWDGVMALHLLARERGRYPRLPFVTVGSAEIFPILGRLDWSWWKRFSEWPYLPITPTMSTVPLPSKWHTLFLQPIHFEKLHPPEAADDPAVVRELCQTVRDRLQAAIDDLLSRCRSIFYGSIFDHEQDGESLCERYGYES